MSFRRFLKKRLELCESLFQPAVMPMVEGRVASRIEPITGLMANRVVELAQAYFQLVCLIHAEQNDVRQLRRQNLRLVPQVFPFVFEQHVGRRAVVETSAQGGNRQSREA